MGRHEGKGTSSTAKKKEKEGKKRTTQQKIGWLRRDLRRQGGGSWRRIERMRKGERRKMRKV